MCTGRDFKEDDDVDAAVQVPREYAPFARRIQREALIKFLHPRDRISLSISLSLSIPWRLTPVKLRAKNIFPCSLRDEKLSR